MICDRRWRIDLDIDAGIHHSRLTALLHNKAITTGQYDAQRFIHFIFAYCLLAR
jgi:hypothetical protein